MYNWGKIWFCEMQKISFECEFSVKVTHHLWVPWIFLPKTLSNPDFFLNGLNRDFLVFPDTKVKGFAKRSPDMKSANGFASSEVVSPEMPQKILLSIGNKILEFCLYTLRC